MANIPASPLRRRSVPDLCMKALLKLSLYRAVNLPCHCFRWGIKNIEIVEVAP